MIRGKKNFLPPHPLVMGFGLLFRLEESSVAAHLHERKAGQELEDYREVHDEIEVDQKESYGICETAEIPQGIDSVSVKEPNSDQELDVEDDTRENAEVPATNIAFEDLMDKALQLSSRVYTEIPNEKYGLDAYPNDSSTKLTPIYLVMDEDENAGSASVKGMQRQRPYLSKAERRKAKKGVLGVDDVDSMSKPVLEAIDTDRQNGDTKGEMSYGGDDFKPESVAVGKIARGRKGKLKKIKEKYAEQDEEERELRMLLLAVSIYEHRDILFSTNILFFIHNNFYYYLQSSGRQEPDVNSKKASKKQDEPKREVLGKSKC